MGDNQALPWQIDNTYKTRPLLLEYFQLNGQAAGLYVDQIISWQKFTTGDIQYLTWPETILFIVFFLALITITTVVTYLDRFTYFIVSGVVVFVLIQLQLEELGISDPYLTYGTIGGYIVGSYLFQSLYPQTKLWIRLLVSIVIYGALVAIILLVANISHPHLVAISFGIMGPAIFATVFIVFIAGDNIFSLFKLTTQSSTNGKNSLKHFLIIGLLYVAITILIFLQRTGYTAFDIYLVNPYILLILSMISGFSALEKKLHSVVNMELKLIKYWLYPIGASLTLVLIGFAHLSVNDSIINAIEWVIILSHMAFAITFFCYALANFASPLVENLEVWHVFFKGLRAPVLVARFLGFVLFLGGMFYLENRPYYQVRAGQYAMLAAVAEKFENPLLTDQYYKQSVFFDFYNFKANYSLARIAKREDEIKDIPIKLNNIIKGGINPKARVAYANYYADRDLLYRELSSLMNSPESLSNPEVKNNLGLSHYRYSNYDSAYKYFSINQQASSQVSEANMAALNYDLAAQINFDTTANYQYTDEINVMINRQALANAQGNVIGYELALNKDTLLLKGELFYLYNAALNQTDTNKEFILNAIDFYLTNAKNQQFSSFLSIAKAVGNYNEGNVNMAFRTLESTIASNQSNAGFPYFMKAVWAFDQGQVEMTVESLEAAQRSGYNEPQIKPFIDELKILERYTEKADISEKLKILEGKRGVLDSTTYISNLIDIANLNAFDESTTLGALERLRAYAVAEKEIYDLLLTIIKVNPKSPKLLEQYIYQCARSGLSNFGRTALRNLEPMMESAQYGDVQEKFQIIQKERREKIIK